MESLLKRLQFLISPRTMATCRASSLSLLCDDLHLIGHRFVFGVVISERVVGRL